MNRVGSLTLPTPGAVSRAAGGLMSDIYELRFPPGSTLPSLAALASRYGETAIAISRALSWLASYGLVCKERPQAPVRVRVISRSAAHAAADRMIAWVLSERWMPGSDVPQTECVAARLRVRVLVVPAALRLVATSGLIRQRRRGHWVVVIRSHPTSWVVENLRRDLRTGNLAGPAFPSIDALASRFGVSARVVAEAKRELIRRRLLPRMPSRERSSALQNDGTAPDADLSQLRRPLRPTPERDRLAGAILRRIVDGDWPACTVLPPREVLARELHGSASMVRTAEVWLSSLQLSVLAPGRIVARLDRITATERALIYVLLHVLTGAWPGGSPPPRDELIAEKVGAGPDDVRAALDRAVSLGFMHQRGRHKGPRVAIRSPLAAAVADAVGAAIDSGVLPAGSLVSGVSLHDALGVSRSVAREARNALERAGYLVSRAPRRAMAIAMPVAATPAPNR